MSPETKRLRIRLERRALETLVAVAFEDGRDLDDVAAAGILALAAMTPAERVEFYARLAESDDA